MLATFLIMLREGLEAALIISIAAIFLARMGKQDLFKYLYIGIAIAAALCLAIGAFFHFAQKEFPQQDQELMCSNLDGFLDAQNWSQNKG